MKNVMYLGCLIVLTLLVAPPCTMAQTLAFANGSGIGDGQNGYLGLNMDTRGIVRGGEEGLDLFGPPGLEWRVTIFDLTLLQFGGQPSASQLGGQMPAGGRVFVPLVSGSRPRPESADIKIEFLAGFAAGGVAQDPIVREQQVHSFLLAPDVAIETHRAGIVPPPVGSSDNLRFVDALPRRLPSPWDFRSAKAPSGSIEAVTAANGDGAQVKIELAYVVRLQVQVRNARARARLTGVRTPADFGAEEEFQDLTFEWAPAGIRTGLLGSMETFVTHDVPGWPGEELPILEVPSGTIGIQRTSARFAHYRMSTLVGFDQDRRPFRVDGVAEVRVPIEMPLSYSHVVHYDAQASAARGSMKVSAVGSGLMIYLRPFSPF